MLSSCCLDLSSFVYRLHAHQFVERDGPIYPFTGTQGTSSLTVEFYICIDSLKVTDAMKGSAVRGFSSVISGRQASPGLPGWRLSLWMIVGATVLAFCVSGPGLASGLTLRTSKLEKSTKTLEKKLAQAEKSLGKYTEAQSKARDASSDKKKKYEKEAEKARLKLVKKKEGLRKHIQDLEKTMKTVRTGMDDYSSGKRPRAEQALKRAEELVVRLRDFLYTSAGALETHGED